jgi:hypothetical protein
MRFTKIYLFCFSFYKNSLINSMLHEHYQYFFIMLYRLQVNLYQIISLLLTTLYIPPQFVFPFYFLFL